jgi:hypothetical protein
MPLRIIVRQEQICILISQNLAKISLARNPKVWEMTISFLTVSSRVLVFAPRL